jgi:hypothetical protein
VWSVITGSNYIFVCYDKDVSEQDALRTAIFYTGVRFLKNNEDVDATSRAYMLLDLLRSDNSIMMLTKDADGRLTYCYDCKSEEDFDDLINMEVK